LARILVVDDEPTNLDLARELLQAMGHQVIEADGADKALALYREHPMDLVITDIFMPKKDGLTLIKELLAAYPDAKIMAVGAGGHDVLELAENAGAHKVMQKPYRVKDLKDAVDDLLQTT